MMAWKSREVTQSLGAPNSYYLFLALSTICYYVAVLYPLSFIRCEFHVWNSSSDCVLVL